MFAKLLCTSGWAIIGSATFWSTLPYLYNEYECFYLTLACSVKFWYVHHWHPLLCSADVQQNSLSSSAKQWKQLSWHTFYLELRFVVTFYWFSFMIALGVVDLSFFLSETFDFWNAFVLSVCNWGIMCVFLTGLQIDIYVQVLQADGGTLSSNEICSVYLVKRMQTVAYTYLVFEYCLQERGQHV